MDEQELMSRLIDAGVSADDVAQATRLIGSDTPEGDTRRRLLADAALLRHGAVCTEPTGGWDAYDTRLRGSVQHIVGHTMADVAPLALSRMQAASSSWRRAALVTLALGGWIVAAWFIPRSGTTDTSSSLASHATSRPDRETDRLVSLNGGSDAIQLFREVESMFGTRTGWVVMHDGTVDMGLRPQTVANPSAPDAIRWASGAAGESGGASNNLPNHSPTTADLNPVVLLELEAGLDGQMLSRAKVAIVPGATAQFNMPDLRTGQQLRFMLATSRERPHRVAVWATRTASTPVADVVPFAAGVVLCATGAGQTNVADNQTVWVADGCTLRLVAAAIESPESQP